MAIEKVREYFKQYKIEDRIIELSDSTATVALAAASLGTEECRIAKTLSFIIEDKPILIVVAGDAKIDNSKYKGHFHIKAKMIPYEEVNNLIGHNPGGVCPFGINKEVTVYLDESLKRFDYVYPACGSSNSAIKLTIEELEKYSNYTSWIDVCKY